MKKYIYLMVVFVLAACAGGGEPDGRFRVSSTSSYFAVTSDAAKSNKNVTTMDSEVLICDGGVCPAHVNRYISNVTRQRSASGGSLYEGSGFKVYGLDNASFITSDNVETEKFTFVIEDNASSKTRGRITHVNWNVGADESLLERQVAEENVFKNSSNNTTLTYNSLAGNELRFSDFGKITVNTNNYMFAGGYEALKHDAPSSDMNFSGKAAGIVSNGDASMNVTGPATLKFDGGNETLNMEFSKGDNPWYDVKIENSDTINFTKNNTMIINDNVKFADGDFVDNVKTGTESVNMNVGYYGAGANIEAAGVINYTENGIRMDAAFGVTKDKN